MPDLVYAIDELTCIECGSCRRYCPVPGAIIISAAYQHTILADICTGCGICEAFCPVPNTIFPVLNQQPYYLELAQTQAVERLRARRRIVWRDKWRFAEHPVMGEITLAARRRLRDTLIVTKRA